MIHSLLFIVCQTSLLYEMVYDYKVYFLWWIDCYSNAIIGL